jgi:predicted nucleotidyltransferase component of viral defense system
MFPATAFTQQWNNTQRMRLGKCDPGILEKCVHALTLVGHLVESRLPFIFKGGTSLLLHLPQVRRLSRDIDIVCGRPAADVDAAVSVIGRRTPFLRWEADIRGARGLPQRRHFKFFYHSALPGNPEQEILLDVVEESREVHTIVNRPIRTSFLEPESEILVRVPTIESLLGDKLTAFAPHTTGVPFYQQNGEEQLQQVAKQLFDVGVLFDVASDFNTVARTYDAVSAQESEYRGNQHSREAALDDTIRACLALTASKKRDLASYPDAPLLHDGMNRLQGHLTWPEFLRGREPRRTLAARAAVLAAHLRAGVPFDFGSMRYTGGPQQLDALRVATLNGTPLAWLDGVKGANAEAYYYWHGAIQLDRANPV